VTPTPRSPTPILVHADESCLGNRSDTPSKGGNAALIEFPAGDSVARFDFFDCSPATTNNRMALAGAIAALEWIRRQWQHARVIFISDSKYLVQGMTEWVPAWRARGWRRKTGAVENLELWQKLDQAAAAHDMKWEWVRGHADSAKNEYADFLARRAAEQQERSNGLVPSHLETWLKAEQAKGRFTDVDPDREIYDRL
jgi:ribonuclease HI